MTRHVLTINTVQDRQKALQGVQRMPWGWTVELREQRRTDEQNRAIHGLCKQVLKQRPIHRGITMTMDKYKAAFMHLLGQEMEFVPALDGDSFFPMGHHTSALTKGEFSKLMECSIAWCIREGLTIEHFDGDQQQAAA